MSARFEPEETITNDAEPVSDVPDKLALTRALRDLEATQARVRENAAKVADDTRTELVAELLPVLDNLERTLLAAKNAGDPVISDGVRMVRDQLAGVLQRYGMESFDADGERFDPALHEAVAVVPVDDPALAGMVVAELAPGFRVGRRLVRAAKVSVGKMRAVSEAPPRPRMPPRRFAH